MKRKVVVSDRMQRRYVYYRTEPAGRNFAPGFRPELTPRQMLALGAFVLHGPPDGDDARQIRRWRAIARHVAAIRKNCEARDLDCRRRQRQAVLHWAYDSRKI